MILCKDVFILLIAAINSHKISFCNIFKIFFIVYEPFSFEQQYFSRYFKCLCSKIHFSSKLYLLLFIWLFFHLKDSLYLFLFLANPLTFANIIVLSVCLYFFLKNFYVGLVFIHKAIFASLFPHHLYHTRNFYLQSKNLINFCYLTWI